MPTFEDVQRAAREHGYEVSEKPGDLFQLSCMSEQFTKTEGCYQLVIDVLQYWRDHHYPPERWTRYSFPVVSFYQLPTADLVRIVHEHFGAAAVDFGFPPEDEYWTWQEIQREYQDVRAQAPRPEDLRRDLGGVGAQDSVRALLCQLVFDHIIPPGNYLLVGG